MQKFLVFSVQEYESRLEKIQAAMANQGLDGLILTKATNLIYVSGYRTGLYNREFRPFICVVPQQGSPTLVVPLLEIGAALGETWFDDVRAWGAAPGDLRKIGLKGHAHAQEPISLTRDVVKEKGLLGGRLGIEMGTGQRLGMTLEQFGDLKHALPDVEFADASNVMWEVRKVKSAKEMEFIKTASRITADAFLAALDFIKAGVSEREIAAVINRAMVDGGAERPNFAVVTTGVRRYGMMNPYPTDTKVQGGDVVLMDIGATYEAYCSDFTRVVFVGGLSERQREFYEAEIKIHEAGVDAAKPGAKVSDVDRAVYEKAEEIGFTDYLLHRTGHSLALDVHELPSVAPGDDTVLEFGTVIAIEPGLYDYEIGAFRIENTGGVTESGFEVFTDCTYALDDVVKR